MSVTGSQEDYLEALYILGKGEPVVRVSDVARFLGVSMASVTGMMRTLSDRNLVRYKRYGYVLLTEEGERIAKNVLRRHKGIKEFLTYILGLSDEEAENAACGMEHCLSDAVAERLARFMYFFRKCPRCGDELLTHFRRYIRTGRLHTDECESCIVSCRESSEGKE